MYEVEKDVLGITHADIGSGLARKWQLPGTLSGVIGGHHDPTSDESNPMAQLVHIANAFSKAAGFAFAERGTDLKIDEKLTGSIDLTLESLEELKSDLDATIRTQVNDTFSAIFK